MALKKWQLRKTIYCEHARQEVILETQIVVPSEALPDQPPRVIAHRCSNAIECNKIEKMTCALCGTNPNYQAS
ncbi:MAG TPA: hypothetical protein PLA27_10755 [Anaerolineales bacterium]|jgi:hypothetical protein|nr:hypothetical protein [Anaerolineales bacterium]HQX16891.1 hypothetical protein [Anaerolineales bacterium]